MAEEQAFRMEGRPLDATGPGEGFPSSSLPKRGSLMARARTYRCVSFKRLPSHVASEDSGE